MHRRLVLAGLAAAAAAPALAQQGGQTMQPAPSGGGMSSGSMGHSGAMRSGTSVGMSDAAMRHARETLTTGMVALETSRIALAKARNPEVKQFAHFEAEEQTTLAEVLHSMMDPSATASMTQGTPGGASGSGTSAGMMNVQMDSNGRNMVEKLRNQQAGAQFDKEYVQGQLQGHRELLQIQERFLQSNPQDLAAVNVTKLARGRIQEHIAELEDIQKKLS